MNPKEMGIPAIKVAEYHGRGGDLMHLLTLTTHTKLVEFKKVTRIQKKLEKKTYQVARNHHTHQEAPATKLRTMPTFQPNNFELSTTTQT